MLKTPLGIAALCLAPVAAATERPNVVFILGDDQAWWDYSFMQRPGVEKAAIDLGASVYQVAETPAIDRLADEGLTFTHGYTTPLCRPSLAAMITGTHPHHNRVTGNDLVGDAPDEAVEYRMQVMQTLPRILQKRLGYTSFQTGKWWEGHHDNGGFTEGDTVNDQSTTAKPGQWGGGRPGYVRARHGDWGLMIGRVDYVNGIANPAHPIDYANTIVPVTDFIDAQVAADQPFFLWYAPFLPHTPHDPPAGLRDKYDALITEPDEAGDYIAKYYANVERFDGGVGALLDHLDSAGIADSTIVVMICDNGWINRTNASAYDARSKRSPYEGGVRTPIIVRWPETIRPGGELEPQIVTTPVSVIDLVPTVLEALELEPSAEMHGLDLLDLPALAARDTIVGEVNDHDMQDFDNPRESLHFRFARRDGWKLILPESGDPELYQLYDETTGAPVDPFEATNLAASETARVTELTAAIEAWYSAGKSMQWGDGPSQMGATHLLPLGADIGQTFEPAADANLAAVRVALRPAADAGSLTLELRELDGDGAPLGHLLASSTLQPEQTVPDETRWYLFPFPEPVPLAAGQDVGFRLLPAPAAGGFEIAYRNPGRDDGGQMFYPGQIDGQDWTAGAFDLTFETLVSHYTTSIDFEIQNDGTGLAASAAMSFKGTPIDLETSPDLATWSHEASDPNLDGLVSWPLPRDRDREFFRARMGVVGDKVNPQPIQTGSVYVENFGGAGGNLDGVAPDTTTDGITWTAPADGTFFDNGSLGANAAGAYLPFVPEHGFVYTLSMEVEMDGVDQDRWLAFGFLENPPTTNIISSGTGGVIWALTRNLSTNDNQVLHENVGGGVGSTQRGDYVTGVSTVSMSLVLDTTGGSGAWTYDWIVNGVTRVDDRPLGVAFESAIGGVGISKRSGSTAKTYSSFSLIREL